MPGNSTQKESPPSGGVKRQWGKYSAISAPHISRRVASMARRDGSSHTTPAYEVAPIVDRIGTGDAFAAGVLHGAITGMDDAEGLHFGLAAACLKHSLPGDFNLVGIADVEAILGAGGFDVKR